MATTIEGIYDRLQKKYDLDKMDSEAIESFIYHGSTGEHQVKWGKDRAGKQRYKTISAGVVGGTTTKGDAVVERLSHPGRIYKDTEDIKKLEELSEHYDDYSKSVEAIESDLASAKPKLREKLKQKREEIIKEFEKEVAGKRVKESIGKLKTHDVGEAIDIKREAYQEKLKEEGEIRRYEYIDIADDLKKAIRTSDKSLLEDAHSRIGKATELSDSQRESLREQHETAKEMIESKEEAI